MYRHVNWSCVRASMLKSLGDRRATFYVDYIHVADNGYGRAIVVCHMSIELVEMLVRPL